MLLTLSVISAQGAELGADAYKVFDAAGGTIGRVDGNSWILPDPDKVVSGRHARVFMRGGAFFLEDLSTNGTFLNSTSVAIERERAAELRDGDRLHIGDYEILVQLIDDAPEAAPPVQPAATAPFRQSPHPPPPQAAPDAAFAPWEAPPMEASPPFAEAPVAGWSPSAVTPAAAPEAAAPAPDAALDPLAALGARGGGPTPRAASEPAAAALIPENWDATSYNVGRAAAVAAAPPPARPATSAARPETPPGRPVPAAPEARVWPLPAASPAGAPPPPAPAQRVQPPPPVRPAPIYQPAPLANSPVGAEAVLPAFCAELGLDPGQLDANAARQMGVILRTVVQGLIGLLQVRSEVKNNFRMSLTSIRPVENNPLKLSLDARDALHNLFVKRNPGYLPPAEAFQEAFQDLEFHQLAMLAGIRAGFNAMIARMTPEHLEEGYARRLKRTALLGVTMKSKYWELYREYFEELERDPEASFQNLFGEEFAKAYHAQIQSLGTSSRHRGR